MKKIIFIIIGVAVLGVIIFTISSKKQVSTAVSVPTQVAQFSITQTIDNQNSSQNISVRYGQTALDVLDQTARIEMKGEGENAFVTGINDITADESKHEFWALYVNGGQAEVGAGSYMLQSGDVIEWKLETY